MAHLRSARASIPPEHYDPTPRYAPGRVIIASTMKQWPVLDYRAHPPDAHPPNCPIRPEYTALECVTQAGSRWYGCERAYINSELRMVVIGHDRRDEVRQQWTIAHEV